MLFSPFSCTRVRALILLPLLLATLSVSLTAQELERSVVGSAGSYFSAVNVGNIHWTVGEVVVDRSANGIVLERGFHHGLYELIATSTWNAPEVQLGLKVFPNPTADEVTLTGDWEDGDQLRINDLLGRTLHQRALPTERAQMSLHDYPAGTYLLTVARAGRPLATLRVIRK